MSMTEEQKKLLAYAGNLSQLAGIRESVITGGRGGGMRIAEVWNAAGLRFTVLPDRCCDIYGLSYRETNLSYVSKNGLTSDKAVSSAKGEFSWQWQGGALVTCGLDNTGGHSGGCPTHGRIGGIPADHFGTDCFFSGDDYILRITGEMRQTRMYGHQLILRRSIETSLFSDSIKIRDEIMNPQCTDETYMLLYHCNFGYPLLSEDTEVTVHGGKITPLGENSRDPRHMCEPSPDAKEELFLCENADSGTVYNRKLRLGVTLSFTTGNLPCLVEWKNMMSHEYVVALEPCNTYGMNRETIERTGKIAVLRAGDTAVNELVFKITE